MDNLFSADADVLQRNTQGVVDEPILKENPDRFVLFPIVHHDIWQFYKKSEANFWTAEEIDLESDLVDWNTKLNALFHQARIGVFRCV
jgi:ribonucleotide reductase beta subunit family protein with ferritin-like domain